MPPIPLPEAPLRAGGIVLRPWREDDLPAALRGSRDPLVPRWTRVPADNTMENLRGYVGTHLGERTAGVGLHLAVVDAETDSFLGAISLLRFEWEDLRCEIGYWLAPEGRGRGAATTAARLLADWALDVLGLDRVELRTHPDNVASQRVAERAGFAREGVEGDEVVFALAREG